MELHNLSQHNNLMKKKFKSYIKCHSLYLGWWCSFIRKFLGHCPLCNSPIERHKSENLIDLIHFCPNNHWGKLYRGCIIKPGNEFFHTLWDVWTEGEQKPEWLKLK